MLLLVVVFAAVLVPPAVRAQAARRHAFVVSFGQPDTAAPPPPAPTRSRPVERRRQILGGLLIAMLGTGLIGLLPTFRTLLVVHLFLLDAFLGYVAMLAHLGDRRYRQARLEPAVSAEAPEPEAEVSRPVPVGRARRGRGLRTELPPVAAVG